MDHWVSNGGNHCFENCVKTVAFGWLWKDFFGLGWKIALSCTAENQFHGPWPSAASWWLKNVQINKRVVSQIFKQMNCGKAPLCASWMICITTLFCHMGWLPKKYVWPSMMNRVLVSLFAVSNFCHYRKHVFFCFGLQNHFLIGH